MSPPYSNHYHVIRLWLERCDQRHAYSLLSLECLFLLYSERYSIMAIELYHCVWVTKLFVFLRYCYIKMWHHPTIPWHKVGKPCFRNGSCCRNESHKYILIIKKWNLAHSYPCAWELCRSVSTWKIGARQGVTKSMKKTCFFSSQK